MRMDTAGISGRWATVLAVIVNVVADGHRRIAVDAGDGAPGFTDRLVRALLGAGQTAIVTTGHGRPSGPDGERDLVIWLRTAAEPQDSGHRARADDADIVVDLNDPQWPVIRHVRAALADRDAWYLSETRAFFSAKASTWDAKFGADLPAYAEAIARTGVGDAAAVADVGCGTGRALPVLRAAVGERGVVVGVDVTEDMLRTAGEQGRAGGACLVMADARRLPLHDGRLDLVFAAGLVGHLPDVVAGLTELARVTRPGGRLALFHPTGRAMLAARHGRTLPRDDPLNEAPLRQALRRAGWTMDVYEDAADRFFVLATLAR
jgi:SAM-dependent methyltransferase